MGDFIVQRGSKGPAASDDFTILELAGNVSWSGQALPLCLASKNRAINEHEKGLIAAGWGLNRKKMKHIHFVEQFAVQPRYSLTNC